MDAAGIRGDGRPSRAESWRRGWRRRLGRRRPSTSPATASRSRPPRMRSCWRASSKGGVEKDEYSRGGAVAALEAQFAALLGKEAAVFMPSGTLANHLAVRALAGPRRRVVVQDVEPPVQRLGRLRPAALAAHAGAAGPGQGDVHVGGRRARASSADASGRVPAAVGGDLDRVAGAAAARRDLRLRGDAADLGGGRAQRGIGLHLDGARLFVACAYRGRTPAEYAALFDTVYVSLWKCFNAGGGAILAGPKATLLADLYHVRRMFGGALWNAWPYAAVARHYAEGYLGAPAARRCAFRRRCSRRSPPTRGSLSSACPTERASSG